MFFIAGRRNDLSGYIRHVMNTRPTPPHRVTRVSILSVTLAALLIVLLAVISPGSAMWWTFIPAMVIACALHLVSTARAAPEATRVLPLYLIALAWQFLHFAEEYTGRFWERWPEDIFAGPPMSVVFFIWGNMGSYAAFTIGALALYKGWRLPLLILWFFSVMGVMGNAIGHPLYVLITGDVFFPGIFTSLAYWIIGPILIVRLWRSSRQVYSAEASSP